MKKFLAFGLAVAFSLTVFAGCDNGNGGNGGENTPPTISGVSATATVVAGTEWDALKGVTASDKEDGDLTSKIEVSARGLEFKDGKVTPTVARELAYKVTYSVTDSDGEKAEATCNLTVQEATAELFNVYESDFSDVTPTWADWDAEGAQEGNNHWWKFEKNADGDKTPEATATLTEGRLAIDVTDLKGLGDDKLMLTRHFNDLEIGTYKFVVWIKSSAAIKINMQAILDEADATNSGWDGRALGNYDGENYYTAEEGVPHGRFGAEVGTSYRAIDFDFSITQQKIKSEKAGALFRIALGGNGNPDAFKADIEKIIVWKTTGVNKETDVFDKSGVSSVADLGLTISKAADGAEDKVTTGFDDADKAAKIQISQYNTSEGCWSIIADIPTSGEEVNTTDVYGYSFDIKADNAYSAAEVHCGPASDANKGDKWYSGDIGTIDSTYKHLYHTFKFGETFTEATVHIFLGKPYNDDGSSNMTATSNTVYIKNFRFFKVEGNEETSKLTEDKFIVFGQASPDKTNPKYPISVLHQSDDKLDTFNTDPMGTAYFENNKLVYLIHKGGTDQGHNKIVFGYWDNPIGPLPADAYYVISFKIKASVAIDFALTLHDLKMGWDEADGGIPIRYCDFGGHELLHAGTEETTIEIESTTASLMDHEMCELLFEFGKFLGTNTEVKIEISDLKIGYRAVTG